MGAGTSPGAAGDITCRRYPGERREARTSPCGLVFDDDGGREHLEELPFELEADIGALSANVKQQVAEKG